MDRPKILIEQSGNLLESGHHVAIKGDKKEVIIMISYVAKEVPEIAEALLGAAALYLQGNPKLRQVFAELAGIN